MSYRSDFPIFTHRPKLVYLDSAATTQKPQVVIDAIHHFLEYDYASVGRGLYPLEEAAEAQFAAVRHAAAAFLQASPEEIVFTRNTTGGLNLLAHSLGRTLKPGDEILLSALEHHSNLLPWRQVAEQTGAKIRVANVTAAGEINLAHLTTLLTEKTKIVTLVHTSNVTGTLTPIAEVKKILTQQGSSAGFIVDASQSAPHLPLSVSELGCDFLVFSGHKVYGPSGTGVLWGKGELLANLPAYEVGGGSVEAVQADRTIWKESVERLEAGTPNLEGTIGLGAALRYLTGIGMETIQQHTTVLSQQARQALAELPEVTILGNPHPASGIISFSVADIHPHDVAEALGEHDICIRAGQHCAGPLHEALNLAASCRVSFGIYTTPEDITRLITELKALIARYR